MYERRESEPAPGSEGRSGPSPVLIGLILVAVLAVVFVLQNGERSEVNFLFLDASAPVWLAIVIAIAIGVLLDRLFLAWWRRRRARSN